MSSPAADVTPANAVDAGVAFVSTGPVPAASLSSRRRPAAVKPLGAARRSGTGEAVALGVLVSGHRAEVERCLAGGRRGAARMARTIELTFEIGADGAVQRIRPAAGSPAESVMGCVVRAASTWAFPVRANGEPLDVTALFSLD
jgi:hypothetical protein